MQSAEENSQTVKLAFLTRTITTADARIAVVRAGAIPYFSDRPAVDMLGMNDRVIAREKMHYLSSHSRLEQMGLNLPPQLFHLISFYPGHLKWDYDYSIGQLKPDVIVELWKEPEEAEKYLRADYVTATIQDVTVYLRKGSKNILWNKLR